MYFKDFERSDKKILFWATALFLLSTMSFSTYDTHIARWFQPVNKDRKQIGTVTYIKKDVRRRTNDVFSWGTLSDERPIYEGDTVFTGDASEVIITTENGEKITVAENSLVVLKSGKDSITIDIGFGSVSGEATSGRKIIISSDNQLSEINEGDAKVKVDAGAGGRLLVDRENNFQIQALSPLSGERIRSKKNLPISFKWKSLREVTRQKLMVSSDPEFKNTLVNIPVKGNSHTSFNLPVDQKLYWKILAEGGESRTNPFWIIGNQPSSPVLPRSGEEFFFTQSEDPKLNGTSVNFQWNGGSPARKYLLQIAENENFSKELQEMRSAESKYKLSFLKKGTYFWRVRSLEYKDTKWSAVSSFEVTPKPTKQLGRPIFLADQKNEIIMKRHNLSAKQLSQLSPRDQRKLIAQFPSIEWAGVSNASQYQIQMSKKSNFSKITIDRKSQKNFYTLKQFKPGEYYWRVRAFGEGFIDGRYTQAEKFDVQLHPPLQKSDSLIINRVPDSDMLKLAPPPITIAWVPTIYTSSYQVQFSEDSSFENAQEFITQASAQKLQVPKAGIYYWRVRALNKNSIPVSRYSDTYPLSIETQLENLSGSQILATIYPRYNQSLLFVGSGTTETLFDWTHPYDTAKYELQVSYEPTFKAPILNTTTNESFYIYKEDFNKQKVFWRVRALTEEKASKWSNTSTFEVAYEKNPFDFETSELMYAARQRAKERQQKLLSAMRRRMEQLRSPAWTTRIRLDQPVVQFSTVELEIEPNINPDVPLHKLHKLSIETHSAQVKNPPLLTWDKVSAAERYFIEIAYDPEFKRRIVNAPTFNPYFLWDSVRPGQFYWRVRAYNERYLPSQYSVVKALRITLPKLNARNDNQVSWFPSLFARKYEVQLSQNTDFKNSKNYIAQGANLNISVAESGTYYWKVRPLNRNHVGLAPWSNVFTSNLLNSKDQKLPPKMFTAPYPHKQNIFLIGSGSEEIQFIIDNSKSKEALLEIAKDKKFYKILSRVRTSENFVKVTDPLPEGKVYWRVRPIEANRGIASETFSQIYEFIIDKSNLNKPSSE